MLLRDPRDGKGAGPGVIATEAIQGQLVKLDNLPGSEGKSRYFLLAGAHEGRVTEIFGLDTVKRLPGGQYAHTEDSAKKAAEALSAYQATLQQSQKLTIVRGRKALDCAPIVEKFADAQRGFKVRAAYDAENLYVQYEVASPAQLSNDWADPQLLFKGGNCLDIQLAADTAADPKRVTPAAGDLRLLVTRQKEKPFAVLYRPKVKDFKGEPVVLSSPTGKESFDMIVTTDKVGLDYSKNPFGFKATATIPLELLGWSPRPGGSVTLDFGYIFGNAQGTQAASRSYWRNNGREANILNDVPSESRLTPAEWGHAVIE